MISLKPGARTLDLPAGFGRNAFLLARAGHRVVAADIDKGRIESVADCCRTDVRRKIHCVVADADKPLPFAKQSFDLVVIVHYYTKPCLASCEQMLKPGGYLILETFNAHGQNWRSLPRVGEVGRLLGKTCKLLELRERRVGPANDRVVVQVLAHRLS